MSHRSVVALLSAAALLSGCIAGAPLSIQVPRQLETEQEMVGVVNGLWLFDPEANRKRLASDKGIAPEILESLSENHQVRVGIKRSILVGSAAVVVVLPDGWRYSATEVVDDGVTVNVGDIVRIRGARGRQVDYLVRIERKCNKPATGPEPWGFDLGCQAVTDFDSNGYGGEKYFLTMF